ncbi:hypothetical protein N7526_001999 [Penicillium atrosanguineum]|nr:hypothetical protein N7526_001999 [Penicillium atrosanguineum]
MSYMTYVMTTEQDGSGSEKQVSLSSLPPANGRCLSDFHPSSTLVPTSILKADIIAVPYKTVTITREDSTAGMT